jgi:hypothetical protein
MAVQLDQMCSCHIVVHITSRDVSSNFSRIQVDALFPPTLQADVNMSRSEKSQQNFPFNPPHHYLAAN